MSERTNIYIYTTTKIHTQNTNTQFNIIETVIAVFVLSSYTLSSRPYSIHR